jgi:hypothetical protein
MADPWKIGAMAWSLTVLSWLFAPVIGFMVNKRFAYLCVDVERKLKEVEINTIPTVGDSGGTLVLLSPPPPPPPLAPLLPKSLAAGARGLEDGSGVAFLLPERLCPRCRRLVGAQGASDADPRPGGRFLVGEGWIWQCS